MLHGTMRRLELLFSIEFAWMVDLLLTSYWLWFIKTSRRFLCQEKEVTVVSKPKKNQEQEQELIEVGKEPEPEQRSMFKSEKPKEETLTEKIKRQLARGDELRDVARRLGMSCRAVCRRLE